MMSFKSNGHIEYKELLFDYQFVDRRIINFFLVKK